MSDVAYEHCADAAGWVLGALSPQAAERFAAHLNDCPACRAEVARLTEASGRLVEAVPLLAPPAELRQRVMASVHAEASLFDAARGDRHPPAPVGPGSRLSWRPRVLLATVAIFAAVIVGVVLLTTSHVSHQGGVRTVVGKVAPRGGARARAVVRIAAHEATLVVTRLAAPAGGRVYQAWVIRRGSAPTPTGALFSVPRSGDTRIVLPSLRDVTEVIVTAEPPRGSPTPTPPFIVLVELTRAGSTALKS